MDVLKPLTGEISPKTYAVLDIESKDGDTQRPGFTRPFLVCYHGPGGEKWHTSGSACIRQAIALVLTRRTEGWVFFAHNGGNFDWLHFLPELHALGFYFEIATVGSGIQLLKVKRSATDKGKGWTFLDSAKLLPMTLEKAGKAFGVGGKSEHDLTWHESDPRWLDYCARDCEVLYRVLERYHDLVEIRLRGEVGISAASTAMKTFRRGYQKTNIIRATEHHALFRESYYGGRNEVFRMSGENLRYYDRNSSYPASMLQSQPIGEFFEHSGRPAPWMLERTIGFVRARVHVPMMHVPPLPWRRPSDGKLLFPVGIFEGAWCHHELLAAEELGCFVEWRDSVWQHSGLPFEAMVRELYAYRDKSLPGYDEGLATVAKILLNSLYGKFAQKSERESIVTVPEGEEAPPDGVPIDPLDPDCRIYRVLTESDSAHIAPQISSNITCHARLSLLEQMIRAEKTAPGTLAYCDTDALISGATMQSDYGLGGWKDELDGRTCRGEFLAPKLYRLSLSDGSVKLAMKGFQASADEKYAAWLRGGKPAVDQLMSAKFDVLKSGEGYEIKSLEKVLTMANNGWRSPQMRSIIKRTRTSENEPKREFDSRGNSKPIIVSEPSGS